MRLNFRGPRVHTRSFKPNSAEPWLSSFLKMNNSFSSTVLRAFKWMQQHSHQQEACQTPDAVVTEIQVQLSLQFIKSKHIEAAHMELTAGQEISNLHDVGSILLSALAKCTVNSTPPKHRALNLATECNFIVLRLC